MSEEIQGAALVVPRSVMISILLNGALGFAVMLVTLFSLTEVESALQTPTGYFYIQVFLDTTSSIPGVTAMVSIVTFMGVFCNIGILATASRMCWSFCRDRGLPGWQFLQHVRDLRVIGYSSGFMILLKRYNAMSTGADFGLIDSG